MANEISLIGSLSVTKNNVTASGSGSLSLTLSGDSYSSFTQVIGTTSEALQLPPDFAWPGWALIKNISPGSETITVSLANTEGGAAGITFGSALAVGEFVLIKPMAAATIFLDGSAATAVAGVTLTEL